MDDLISRQALYGEFNKLSKPFDGSDIWHLINAAPSIEATPVRRGRWKWIFGKPYCEFCAVEPYRASNKDMPNFCPNCGAKMDGGKDDAAR